MRRHLDADPAKRDYDKAADVLLRVSGNVTQYNMIRRVGPRRYAAFIDRRLNDYYQFRLKQMTHEQVAEMSDKADAIVAAAPKEVERVAAGRRADHDSLPEDIQAAYITTLDLLRKQQELHRAIRSLALAQAPCPDSEIYPFVKEIIELDQRRLALWKKYDSYGLKASKK